MPPVNPLAIIVAALSSFVLGGLRYGPLFGTAWMKENGLTPEDVKNGNPAKIFGLSFLWTLVMAYNLGFFLADPAIGLSQGLMYGFLTGFGWIAMGVFVIGLFERRSGKLMTINGAFMTVSLALMGFIIGAWC